VDAAVGADGGIQPSLLRRNRKNANAVNATVPSANAIAWMVNSEAAASMGAMALDRGRVS